MPLLNYTTSIESAKTIGEIQAILVKHGARAISMKYNDKAEAEALSFLVKTAQGDLPIRLPVDVEAVFKVMSRDFSASSRRRIRPTKDQATRVAWRIMKDWIEAQMAILETEMVKLEEVFLPYMVVDGQQTLYEVIRDRQFLLPPGR